MLRSFSAKSFLETLAMPGWITSKTNCLRPSKGLFWNLRVRTVNSDMAGWRDFWRATGWPLFLPVSSFEPNQTKRPCIEHATTSTNLFFKQGYHHIARTIKNVCSALFSHVQSLNRDCANRLTSHESLPSLLFFWSPMGVTQLLCPRSRLQSPDSPVPHNCTKH